VIPPYALSNGFVASIRERHTSDRGRDREGLKLGQVWEWSGKIHQWPLPIRFFGRRRQGFQPNGDDLAFRSCFLKARLQVMGVTQCPQSLKSRIPVPKLLARRKLMPGGANSPARAFHGGRQPLFIERAEGPYLYDIDGIAISITSVPGVR
jgi:hypothetical protein